MDDVLIKHLRLARRMGHTEVVERPGADGFTSFYVPWTAYTPTYLGGTTAGTTTYSTQTARYTRIGNTVIARGQVTWTNATGTGNARISLPVAVAAGAGGAAGSVRLNNVTFAGNTPTPFVTASQSYFELSSPSSNAAESVVAVETAGNIQFEIIYEV